MAGSEAMKTAQQHEPLEYSTQESRLNILGFWIFLGAEIALFATLFATYWVMAGRTAGGPGPSELFELKEVLIETLLLLTSSFTCGLAVHEMRGGRMKSLVTLLIITLLLGLGFVGMEISEFVSYVSEGATLQTSAFLSGFFVLVGTHGLHVSLGICWMTMIIIQLLKRGFTPETTRKTFIVGLYWHFLDVVWIFLFTIVYLRGMM